MSKIQEKKYFKTEDTEFVGGQPILYRSEAAFRNNVLTASMNEKIGKDYTFNDYIKETKDSLKIRLNKMIPSIIEQTFSINGDNINNWLASQFRLNGYADSSAEELNARINSMGQFFQRTLTTVDPTLYIEPIRGISFFTFPMVSYGLGSQTYERQAFNGNAIFTEIQNDLVTENIQNIQISGSSNQWPIKKFTINNALGYFQVQAMNEAIKRCAGDSGYDPFVGFIFSEFMVKYLVLPRGYSLLLDNLAYLGQETQDSPQTTYQIVDGTGDNGVPLLTLTDIFGSSAPSDFKSATVAQKVYMLGQIVANVSNVSFGAKRATKLWIDLYSYTAMMGEINDYKDTDPLGYLYNQALVDMIVPVAAWSVAFPDQTTIFVAEGNTQTMNLNVTQPLSMAGVSINTLQVIQSFVCQTTGVTVAQGIGATQFVCVLNPSSFGKNFVKPGTKKMSEYTTSDLKIMKGLHAQLNGTKKSLKGLQACPTAPTAKVQVVVNGVKEETKSQNDSNKQK